MIRDLHPEGPVSDYREFAPLQQLRTYLLCFWTQFIQGGGKDYEHRVLPDGCIDIVFINSDPAIVVGPWTEPFVANFAPGTTILGARFHPGRAVALLGLPAVALLNQSVGMHDISRNAFYTQFARIADSTTLSHKLSTLENALLGQLPGAPSIDPTVSAAIDWLASHPNGRVEQLSEWIGMSGRQLQRRFLTAVGYGPKMFQSVLRFQRLLQLAGRNGIRPTLAGLAADAGYADQAHMTREVCRFSGTNPRVLLGSADCTLGMSTFFDTTA